MLDVFEQVRDSLSVENVSIEEFAESPDYCDKPLYPRQKLLLKLIFLEELTPEEDEVLDFWIAGGNNGEIEIPADIRERIAYLKANGYKHFREVVLVGGRRSSKGFVTGLAMGKVMYDTLKLEDPGRYYGIDPKKNIMFSCIAGSEEQAREYQFADLSNTIESCKAMDKHLVKSLETEARVATNTDLRQAAQSKARGNKVQKDIARLRAKALASNAGTIRGSATMAVCIDEMAFMLEGLSKASADVVYQAIEPSLDQFKRDGIMFCNSSPYTKLGKFFERYELGMKPLSDEGNPRMFTFRFPSWALFEGFQGYKNKYGHSFRTAITVSPDWDPDERDEDGNYIFADEDREAILEARAKEAANPEAYKVERRGQFAEVTDAYLNPAMVDQMFAGRPMGYTSDLHVIHEPMRTNWGEGVRNIYRYKAHLDPSSTTAGFGFALGHVENFVNPSGTEDPHVVFDIIKRWQPRHFKGGAIKWDVVMREVMGYIELFRPYELTLDQYQSHEPIQTLNMEVRERGLSTRIHEIIATPEINWKRYENYKTALYQGLVHAPWDTDDIKYAALELKFLQETRTASKFARIDHPTVGEVKTKDMADCIAEVTSALLGNFISNMLQENLAKNMMVPGAQGGFRIGGNEHISQRGRQTPEGLAAALARRRGEQALPGSTRPRPGIAVGRRRARGI